MATNRKQQYGRRGRKSGRLRNLRPKSKKHLEERATNTIVNNFIRVSPPLSIDEFVTTTLNYYTKASLKKRRAFIRVKKQYDPNAVMRLANTLYLPRDTNDET